MNTDADTPTPLNAPVVDGGLEHVPFFNGRVLTADDLEAEQDAHAAERRHLGRALGTGVVDGLFVRKTSDETVTVESGLGLAPSGRRVELPQATEVSVVSSIEREGTAGTKGRFADCATQDVTIDTGSGAYLLVVEPASKPQGRVPRTSLGGDGAFSGSAGECGAERRVEGAKLRLVYLDTSDDALVPPSLADGDGESDIQALSDAVERARENGEEPRPEDVSKLRNILAHVCLRTPSALTETASLYDTLRAQSRGTAEPAEGPFDQLRKRARERERVNDLEDAVPLGLLYWSGDRIEFVDVWSLRRRVHRSDSPRPAPATARRRAETEAAIFQFQAQVADLERRLASDALALVPATEYFCLLPPVGVLPEQADGQPGFSPLSFFEGIASRGPVFIDGSRLPSLLRRAGAYASRRLGDEAFWWLYRVRQNREGAYSGLDTRSPSAYLVFASGTLPFAGETQYDLARWNYGNFGPGVEREL
jgi:hypothetical protein